MRQDAVRQEPSVKENPGQRERVKQNTCDEVFVGHTQPSLRRKLASGGSLEGSFVFIVIAQATVETRVV
jgi:hypothetical protein